MRSLAFAVVVLVAACGPKSATTTPGPTGKIMTVGEIATMATPSIVTIKTKIGSGEQGTLGTGFVVWQDGRIATNLHIIAGARQASIVLHDKREFDDIEVLAIDQQHDLAILRIPGLKDLPVLKAGDPAAVKTGDHIVAIGNPLGLETTVSDGLVSAVRELDPDFTVLQISAPISPGSSGGPLFNERGEVIGITTAFAAEGQNINFALPITYIKPLLLKEKPVPLAAFAREMDLQLFAGCTPEEVEGTVKALTEAISVGVPLFNKGDAEGCFKVYEGTALKLVGDLKACPGIETTLLDGLKHSSETEDSKNKAWAMRHAFDRILNAVSNAVRDH